MNYGEAKTQIMDAIGAFAGELDDEVATFVKNAILDIWGENSAWSWNQMSSTVVVRGKISGTATWVKGATTLAIDTGAPATQSLGDEYAGGLIEFGGTVYVVKTFTAPSTITLEAEIVQASGTAAAFTWIQDTVTFPSDVDSISEIRDYEVPRPIRLLRQNERSRLWPNPFRVLGSDPRSAWFRGVDANGDLRVGFYPPGSIDKAMFYVYNRRAALPTQDADDLEAITGIPAMYHPVIVARAKEKAYEHEMANDSARARAGIEYYQGIQRMRKFDGGNAGPPMQIQTDRGRRHIYDNPDIREPV